MKRLLAIRGGRRLLICAMLVAALLVPSAADAAKPPAGDSATGIGSTDLFSSFDFTVSSGSFGENPTGHGVANAFGFPLEIDSVSCMSVSGNAVTLGVVLKPNGFGFGGALITAVDNGPAGSGRDYFNGTPLGTAPTTCPAPYPIAVGNLLTGDIVVADAARRPGLGCGDKNHTHASGSACGRQKEIAGLKEDTAAGTGDFGIYTNVDLAAKSGPKGENPAGHLNFDAIGDHFESSAITCLSVSNNAATVRASLKPNNSGFAAIEATVIDYDPGNSSPDGFTALPVSGDLTACPVPAPFALSSGTGEIVVRDAGAKH